MRPRYLLALGVVAFIVVAMIVYTKILDSLIDDETRIRNVIATIADSMGERNLREISRHVHTDFTTEAYNLDRPTAMAILRRIFLSYPIIRVTVRDVSVEIIDETTAKARFVATARGARSADSHEKDILQHRGSERFLLTFKKEDGDWEIIRSQIIRSTAD